MACVSGNGLLMVMSRIFGNACVYGNTRIFGNACIYGDACVSGGGALDYPRKISCFHNAYNRATIWYYCNLSKSCANRV